jgi:hypothetical protein
MDLIRDVERRMLDEYAHLPEVQVSQAIAQAHSRFAGSRIRDFVPLFVERRVRAELSGKGSLVGSSA